MFGLLTNRGAVKDVQCLRGYGTDNQASISMFHVEQSDPSSKDQET